MANSRPRSPWPRWAIRRWRAFGGDARAAAAVEAALILPSALLLFALLLYGAEGFAIQRKVTLTARTVTDLITQTTPFINGSGQPSLNQSTIDDDLAVASAVLAPYAAANMSMVVSEVLVQSNATTAKVQWSEPYNGATARPANQVITLPTGLGTGQAGNYFVLGEVYYNYTPLNFYMSLSAITLSDSIYLTPRASASIAMNVGS
jgi:Flp pilus assembly protein TadG